MNFVYPQSILTPRLVDEMFQEEAEALRAAGHHIFRLDSETLTHEIATIKPTLPGKEPVVYRGWMLSAVEYQNFARAVAASAAQLFTSPANYLLTHHLPNWYQLLTEFTPQTVFLSLTDDWPTALAALGWQRFFIKDYVKSLKTARGSIINRPEEIHMVALEMEQYRGTIEGGLCIRQVEDFLPTTEQRFFVLNGQPYAAAVNVEIPAPVQVCAQRIASNFFSVDIVERADGKLRIVELGDGQVSDLVGWTIPRFVELWD